MPSDPSKTPFADVYGKGLFDYFKDNPTRGSNFNVFMEGHQEGKRNWLDIYPLQDRLAHNLNEEENAVLLVDIGGGVGHDLRDFGNRRGSMPGRLVLQDLPAIISEVDSSKKPAVEAMAYDYYTPQPIEGKLHDRRWKFSTNVPPAMHRSKGILLSCGLSHLERRDLPKDPEEPDVRHEKGLFETSDQREGPTRFRSPLVCSRRGRPDDGDSRRDRANGNPVASAVGFGRPEDSGHLGNGRRCG